VKFVPHVEKITGAGSWRESKAKRLKEKKEKKSDCKSLISCDPGIANTFSNSFISFPPFPLSKKS